MKIMRHDGFSADTMICFKGDCFGNHAMADDRKRWGDSRQIVGVHGRNASSDSEFARMCFAAYLPHLVLTLEDEECDLILGEVTRFPELGDGEAVTIQLLPVSAIGIQAGIVDLQTALFREAENGYLALEVTSCRFEIFQRPMESYPKPRPPHLYEPSRPRETEAPIST